MRQLPQMIPQAYSVGPFQMTHGSLNSAEVTPKKRQALFAFIITYCNLTGGQVLMKSEDAELRAVACLETTKPRTSFIGALHLSKALVTYLLKCGFTSLKKMNTYMRITSRYRPKEKHHYLICIGVVPEFMGQGIGKNMLTSIHAIVDADPSSIGISLDTENPENVALYEHFGYQLTGSETFDGLTIYTMFRYKSKS